MKFVYLDWHPIRWRENLKDTQSAPQDVQSTTIPEGIVSSKYLRKSGDEPGIYSLKTLAYAFSIAWSDPDSSTILKRTKIWNSSTLQTSRIDGQPLYISNYINSKIGISSIFIRSCVWVIFLYNGKVIWSLEICY